MQTVIVPVSDQEWEAFVELLARVDPPITVGEFMALGVREFLADQTPLVPNLG